MNAKDSVTPLQVVSPGKSASYAVAISLRQTAHIVSSLITSGVLTVKEHIGQMLFAVNYLTQLKKLNSSELTLNQTLNSLIQNQSNETRLVYRDMLNVKAVPTLLLYGVYDCDFAC